MHCFGDACLAMGSQNTKWMYMSAKEDDLLASEWTAIHLLVEWASETDSPNSFCITVLRTVCVWFNNPYSQSVLLWNT